MQRNYIIKIHSFIDLITNSSTEIFVEANQNTIKSVKSVIDNILKLAGSNFTADDLFEFSLVLPEVYDEEKDEYVNDVDVKSKLGKAELKNSEGGQDINLLVKAKDENSPEAKEAAKVLSKITSWIETGEQYNQ